MTPERLERLVGLLPPYQREALALGPLEELEADEGVCCCRVCVVLCDTANTYSLFRLGGKWGRAALALFDWHQGLDAGGMLPALTCGPEAYRRCCAIYRAAGWQES